MKTTCHARGLIASFIAFLPASALLPTANAQLCECPHSEFLFDQEHVRLGDQTSWGIMIYGSYPLNLGGTFSHAADVSLDAGRTGWLCRDGTTYFYAPMSVLCTDGGRVVSDTAYTPFTYVCQSAGLPLSPGDASYVKYAPGFATGTAITYIDLAAASGTLQFPSDLNYMPTTWSATGSLCTVESSTYEFSGVDDHLTLQVDILPDIACYTVEQEMGCENDPADVVPTPVVRYNLDIAIEVEFADSSISTENITGYIEGSGDGSVTPTGVFADTAWFDWSGTESSSGPLTSCDPENELAPIGISCLPEPTGSFDYSSQMHATTSPSIVWTSPSNHPGIFEFDGSTTKGEVVRLTILRRAWLGEAEEPVCHLCPPCPADFNMDGGIDGQDLTAFYAAYETGDPCADVDGNGGIDGADLVAFYAAYELGGC